MPGSRRGRSRSSCSSVADSASRRPRKLSTDGRVGWALDPAHASPSVHISGVGTGDRVDMPVRTGPPAADRVRGTGIAETGLVDVRVQAIDAERRRTEVPGGARGGQIEPDVDVVRGSAGRARDDAVRAQLVSVDGLAI